MTSSSEALNLNQWYSVVATYITGNVSLYVNGVFKENVASTFDSYVSGGIESVGMIMGSSAPGACVGRIL